MRIDYPAAVLLLAAVPAQAQDPGAEAPVQYDVAFPDAVRHEARITATWRQVPPGPLRLQMARSSPGRYAIHEFAKNVYAVAATDGAGKPLRVVRTDPYGLSVAGHDGTVTVNYTLFGDRTDGTYAQIDRSHAHLNSPATFLWATGYDAKPIRVRFRPADPKWKIATQLPAAGGTHTYWAPNLQYLMDSPTELSDHAVREWQVGNQTIRLAVHHLGTDADVDRLADRLKRVTAQHAAVFGGLPRFDHGSYTFIADYLPWASGDGMEHRNSTIISGPQPLEGSEAPLGTASHEFVHAWNVERLRPAELEPFDFTRANPTPSLWFAEGFTHYYGPLLIRRAGEATVDAYLADLGRTLSQVVNVPARRYGGPQEMSLRAPFTDAARSIDPTNPHIFVSYYPYGAVVGLALDLSLRARPGGRTLDDYMRQLWRTHGAAEKPYTPADLRRGLAELTGDADWAAGFFASHVEGSDLPDFTPLLARAGLLLRPARPERGWLGAELSAGEGGAAVGGAPVPGSPLYEAGVGAGDVIVSPDAAALGRVRPGERVAIAFLQRGAERRATLVAVADPTLEIVRYEAAGRTLTPAQRAFRDAWLGP